MTRVMRWLVAMGLIIAIACAVPGSAEAAYGADGIDRNRTYTMEEMLIFAIQDEYLARETYRQAIEELGAGKPFTNIVRSEENHIAMLKVLFRAYGIPIPKDEAAEYVELPPTVLEVAQAGIEGEIRNIEMYDYFLTHDLPGDVQATFERLRAASFNHLHAFERVVQRGYAKGHSGWARGTRWW